MTIYITYARNSETLSHEAETIKKMLEERFRLTVVDFRDPSGFQKADFVIALVDEGCLYVKRELDSCEHNDKDFVLLNNERKSGPPMVFAPFVAEDLSNLRSYHNTGEIIAILRDYVDLEPV